MTSDIKQCPYCAEDIKAAAIVCKHCGRELPDDEKRALIPEGTATAKAKGQSVTFGSAANYSEAWRKDAENETMKEGIDARRREIIFAVCYAESYLFECTRRHMGKVTDIDKYYPGPGKKQPYDGLVGRWKKMPEDVYKNINQHPLPVIDVSELKKLMEFRNGLVHARASRVYVPDLALREPFPKNEDLEIIEPDWALDIVDRLVASYPMPS